MFVHAYKKKKKDTRSLVTSLTESSTVTGVVELPKQPQNFRSLLVVSKPSVILAT